MLSKTQLLTTLAATLFGLSITSSAWAQDTQQQYPPQYPPTGSYPQSQQQYPPPQQGQYPPPQQGQYPQSPTAGQYPQSQYPPPQYGPTSPLPPQQLDQLVGPIALYPDGLLAQVLTASSYWQDIPEAARWANDHAYLRGEALAQAIRQDNLPWAPSVMALLPFPSTLNYMAQYMGWTTALGNAVLTGRDQVMDAIQRLRQEAYSYGYLRDTQYIHVIAGPGEIEILPVQPGLYYVPYYNPLVVFARPRSGFVVSGAIRFGPGIGIGVAFNPWGWGGVGFGWREHRILIDNRPWVRTWDNRGAYVHPYATPYRHDGPRAEHHEVREGREHEHEHDRR